MFFISLRDHPDNLDNLGSCTTFIGATMRMFNHFQKDYILVSAADYGDFCSYWWRKKDNKYSAHVRVNIFQDD